MYKKLKSKCLKTEKTNKEITKTICNKWNDNKYKNPFTYRLMNENSVMYKKLKSKCLKTEKKINNNYKKIGKLFLPFINRVSANLIDRINYYLLIRNYIKKIKNKYKNNCLRVYKYNTENKPIYRIGNRLILTKQIGTQSAYGVVYTCYYRPSNIINKSLGKFNKFAVKIVEDNKNNRLEIDILNKLTKFAVYLECPHFPILYGTIKCDNINSKNKSNYDSENSNNSLLNHKNNANYPAFAYTKKLYMFSELANGDFKNYIEMNYNNDDIMLNAIAQIFISLMFFHKKIKAYHCDSHSGNFLYHKIKPGGYIHYNIHGVDYYLKNIGYLWIIWDFGLITPFVEYDLQPNKILLLNITYDYKIIMHFLCNRNNETNIDLYGLISNKYLFSDYINKLINNINNNIILKYKNIKNIKDIHLLEKSLLKIMCKFIPTFTNTKPINVINKKPYII